MTPAQMSDVVSHVMKSLETIEDISLSLPDKLVVMKSAASILEHMQTAEQNARMVAVLMQQQFEKGGRSQ